MSVDDAVLQLALTWNSAPWWSVSCNTEFQPVPYGSTLDTEGGVLLEKELDLDQDGVTDVTAVFDDGELTVTIHNGAFGVVLKRVILAISSTIAVLSGLLFSL